MATCVMPVENALNVVLTNSTTVISMLVSAKLDIAKLMESALSSRHARATLTGTVLNAYADLLIT